MALPDKHQLKFNTHKDAKTLMEAIEKRFGGNTKTKKKLISQLEILRVFLSQEDINLKFLRSLPSEWRTYTLIWRNKIDLEEQSLDDLFNRLKIYEVEVKNSSSASTSTQNIAFVSSFNTDSTNEPVSAAASVSAVSAKILVSALPNVDSLMRARRFLQRTGRNLGENGPTSMGFDMSKVECYNCHMKGHFARKCRSPKDTKRNGAAEPQRRNVPVENSTSNALVSQCDGVDSYDWSFQVEKEPTNYALMTFSSLSSSSDNEIVSCSKACTKAYATLQSHYDKLTANYKKSQFDVISYQTGLESVEARLLVFTRAMFDYDDYLSSGSDESLPPSPIYDRYQSSNGYHTVPPPYTGAFMPPKLNLVFNNAPNDVETDHPAFTVKLSPTKPDQDLPSVLHVETFIPPANSKTAIPTHTCNGTHENKKACFVYKSLDHLIKDCDYHEKKMAQTTTRTHVQRGTDKKYAQMPLLNPQRYVVPATGLPQSKLVLINAVKPVSTVVLKISVTSPRRHINRSPSPKASTFPLKVTAAKGNPQHALKDKVVIDSGCSRHMTGNKSYLSNFAELNRGYVAFGGNPMGGKISGKDSLRKFDGKVDEGFLVRYYVSSKAFRVFNSRTQIVQETLHVNFLENKPNVASYGPTWFFDIDTLTKTMTYQPVTAGNQSNPSTGVQEQFDVEKVGEENVQQYVLFPGWSFGSINPKNTDEDAAFDEKEPEIEGRKLESEVNVSPSSKCEDFSYNSINEDNVAGSLVPVVGKLSPNSTNTFSAAGPSNVAASPTHRKYSCIDTSHYPGDPNMLELEDITYFDDEDDVGAEADFNNLETSITVSPIPTTRVYKDHPVTQIIEELLQLKMQKVWILVNLPHRKRAIGTKWVFRNKKDERGIVVRNKARLVAQGHTQEEGIDYKEVFALVARIEAIRLFLAYASFIGFMVYQMDVKSAFLYGTIEEEQCKKQTVVATSSTKAEYVAAASCCAQVLWIQNQLLDYGKQVGDLSTHTTKYTSPALIQKVFANIRRVGKGCSGVETSLFEGMIVAQEVGEGADKVNVDDVPAVGVTAKGDVSAADDVVPTAIEEPSIPSPTPHTPPPQPSQDQPSTSQERIIADMHADVDVTLKDVADVVKDVADVVKDVADVVKDVAQDDEINETKSKDKGKGILVEELKPPKKQAQTKQDEAYARELEAELNKNIDWDEVIDHVQRNQKEDNVVKRYQALKRKPRTEAQARKNMMIYLRNVVGFKMDYFKGMTYDDIRLIFKKYFNSNKLDEEVEELRRHLQIVPNHEDDVYTEATPLTGKVLVVDYEIYTENNKPYYKTIRAGGSPQLFLSFLSLLRNFDREDLEVLWELVKERFASSKPKNFSVDFLMTTFTYMFKKPDVQAQVWKSQRTVHVKRRYLLSRFTLDQLINTVRLKVEEESEVSLELLRFIRQQQQEGFRAE
uniref:Copia protein n=1 Tax=Tanacetum cinerariifolium TaxID=118510 RepID=A0A6L2JNM7_TANCI|nr:copia protein [Tanacetum cinerariifolium]